MSAPLDGIRVLDLTRVLAGPSCTQLLGDLGAEIIKIERPGSGDDTRKWGPPFVTGKEGVESDESAYFISVNRNKRSVAVDISVEAGQDLVRHLAAKADVFIENFKVGDMARYGLDAKRLRGDNPGLIYCSITGFGQTGPYAARAGYDYMAQALGGLMSITGEPDGEPVKVGVGIADLITGAYAAQAILAALFQRTRTGRGDTIDLALLDSQMAWLSYEGSNHLVSGKAPKRWGNGHPNLVPYGTFETSDGWMVLACGNDSQFTRFCNLAGRADIAQDERYATGRQRLAHREELLAVLRPLIRQRSTQEWLTGLEKLKVPSCSVNSIPEAFRDPHVQHRGTLKYMDHEAAASPIPIIANPIKFEESVISYRQAPPLLGQHTAEVLQDWLDLDPESLDTLQAQQVIG